MANSLSEKGPVDEAAASDERGGAWCEARSATSNVELIPPRWRDVDNVGVLTYSGKDSKQAREAWSISLGSQPDHHLVARSEAPGSAMQIDCLLVPCILTHNPIMKMLMQLTSMLGKCKTEP